MPTPNVSTRSDGLQVSYGFGQHLQTSKPYPLPSPNGSSIILYGHKHGLGIIWCGDRKRKRPEEKSPALNGGSNNNEAMIITDSDSDEAVLGKGEPAEFEEEEEDRVELSQSYEPIISKINVHLGVEVLTIAVPRLNPEQFRRSPQSFPPILSTQILAAITCSDCTVRIITIPLIPPIPGSEDSESHGERIVTLGNNAGHQDIANGVSISFAEYQPRHKSIEDEVGNSSWDLLLASHSGEVSRLLLVYRIPISPETGLAAVSNHVVPIQRVRLASPAVTVTFRPMLPGSQAPSQLLVAYANGAVKILLSISIRPNRGSQIRDSSTSSASSELWSSQPSWAITLYPGFEQGMDGTSRRKRILAADWVLAGKAVICLLADGQWGIWDVEGTGLGTGTNTALMGGSITAFTINDWIGGLPASHQTSSAGKVGSSFVPMTPGTRRVREEVLFNGPAIETDAYVPGAICVQTTNLARQSDIDESILLMHGSRIVCVPSILSYCSTKLGRGTFLSSSRRDTYRIEGVDLRGEKQIGVDFLRPPSSSTKTAKSLQQSINVLVITESRLNMIVSRQAEICSQQPRLQSSSLFNRPANIMSGPNIAADQSLLARGELDVDGVDRMLDDMAKSTHITNTTMNGTLKAQKKVLFAPR
ncbi:MAG: hypothetical protein M1834_008767 [Cirrosporium novae-zelandiae]|nr:MAG: hypothetical protein M1834_008767 [Cirrosporium novae-zelandiae]